MRDRERSGGFLCRSFGFWRSAGAHREEGTGLAAPRAAFEFLAGSRSSPTLGSFFGSFLPSAGCARRLRPIFRSSRVDAQHADFDLVARL